jgi:hypothetical protein
MVELTIFTAEYHEEQIHTYNICTSCEYDQRLCLAFEIINVEEIVSYLC